MFSLHVKHLSCCQHHSVSVTHTLLDWVLDASATLKRLSTVFYNYTSRFSLVCGSKVEEHWWVARPLTPPVWYVLVAMSAEHTVQDDGAR